jgi:hypothetical protein
MRNTTAIKQDRADLARLNDIMTQAGQAAKISQLGVTGQVHYRQFPQQ